MRRHRTSAEYGAALHLRPRAHIRMRIHAHWWQLFEVGWRKLETTFDNKNLDYLKVDGVNDPELRKQLWEISGARNYPQVFVPSDGALKFVGGMDEIQEVSDKILCRARATRSSQRALMAGAKSRARRRRTCPPRADVCAPGALWLTMVAPSMLSTQQPRAHTPAPHSYHVSFPPSRAELADA